MAGVGSSSSLVLRTLNLKNPKLLLLESCSAISDFKIIHGHMIRTLTISDVFAASRLISSSVNAGFLDYAVKVFRRVSNPNLFIFNALIRGFSASRDPSQSFRFYLHSRRLGILPDNLTYPFLVKSCAEMGSLKMGAQAHGEIVVRGFENDLFVQNSLVNMYAHLGEIVSARCVFNRIVNLDVVSWTSMIAGYNKVGDVVSARQLFDKMPEKNLVTWSTMINGYVKNSFFKEAVALFRVLQARGIRANETVMASVVASCAHLGAPEVGEKAHDYIVRNKLTLNLILGTALVEMYAKCGAIEKSIDVFEQIPEKDALCWTSLISGFAMHGYAKKAVDYFYRMVSSGVPPKDITFTAVLSACSHGGLVEKGREIFDRMKIEYGVNPRLEHYGCMVDLLGRAGKLEEAEKFVLEMPVEPNAPIWGALLGACKIHRNADVAERVGKILTELKPDHSGYYVLLSNIFARAKMFKNVEKMRQAMKEKGVKKPPGYSLIEMDGEVHRFTLGDKSHPEIDRIERTWDEIVKRIRNVGYLGNTDDALFDVEEEEKETAILRHSEKLAIAYAIMKSSDRSKPIRIVKNLRVCEDCHTASKLISKVYGRELIVRDRNRFHHFRGGTCSCMDYW
ncbi:Pentatricopeptide repeat-containing protein At5g06540 [Linum grandiflorum]